MRTLAFIVLIGMLAACGGSPNVAEHQQSPEGAVKAFFEALSNNEFEKAAALGTDVTKKQVKLYLTDLNIAQDSKEEAKALQNRFKLDFQKLECAERSGTMTCVVCCNTSGGEATVELHQKDERWFVHTELGDYQPNAGDE